MCSSAFSCLSILWQQAICPETPTSATAFIIYFGEVMGAWNEYTYIHSYILIMLLYSISSIEENSSPNCHLYVISSQYFFPTTFPPFLLPVSFLSAPNYLWKTAVRKSIKSKHKRRFKKISFKPTTLFSFPTNVFPRAINNTPINWLKVHILSLDQTVLW